MNYYEKLTQIGNIYESLQDDISKKIFEARVDYMSVRNRNGLIEKIYPLANRYVCKEFEAFLQHISVKGVIIFGAGYDGKMTHRLLHDCGHSVQYFCDSDDAKVGTYIGEREVLSVETVVREYRDYLVVLASRIYADEMHEILNSKGFPKEHILHPRLNILVGECGWQYFDVFPPEEIKGGVFIDAGCWNGDTIEDYIKYSGDDYERVIAFEPLEEMCLEINARIRKEKWKQIEVENAAVWDCRQVLGFVENTTGSRVEKNGERKILGVDIDSIVKKDKVTFLKMDVEGAELKALEGARATILHNKPRLAISVYHKAEDIIDIPYYIMNLVPEYKFFLRHYSSAEWETVLYAEI